jgi:RsiW-degrading membrane proteinase PrsW (M82 family)
MIENNILPFIFTFLPALIYVYFIGGGKVDYKKTMLFIIFGIISIPIVSSFLYIFPTWSEINISDFVFGKMYESFISVALLEEFSKLLTFIIITHCLNHKDNMFNTTYNVMCISIGFAIFENLSYLKAYGSDILLTRSITAVILHTTVGIMMGFFVAIGNLYEGKQKYYNYMIGLLIAIIFHGLYDFQLMVTNTLFLIILILLSSVYISNKLLKKIKLLDSLENNNYI